MTLIRVKLSPSCQLDATGVTCTQGDIRVSPRLRGYAQSRRRVDPGSRVRNRMIGSADKSEQAGPSRGTVRPDQVFSA